MLFTADFTMESKELHGGGGSGKKITRKRWIWWLKQLTSSEPSACHFLCADFTMESKELHGIGGSGKRGNKGKGDKGKGGVIPQGDDKGKAVQEQPARPEDVPNDIQDTVDWSDLKIIKTPIRDQGRNNYCWGISVAATTEAVYNLGRPRSPQVSLSAQELLNHVIPENSSLKDGKVGSLKPVWRYIKNAGLSEEGDYRYGAKKLDDRNFLRLRKAVKIGGFFESEDVKEMELIRIVSRHPVAAVMVIDNNFRRLGKDDVYRGPTLKDTFGHAVVIVGYGKSRAGIYYWKIRNSSGANWGDGGYGKVIRKISQPNKKSLFVSYSYPEGVAAAGKQRK